MRKRNLFIVVLLAVFIFTNSLTVLAHSGRTDKNGGHWDRQSGTYHYHNGGTTSSGNNSYSTMSEAIKNELNQKEMLLVQQQEALLMEIQNLEAKIEELKLLKNEIDKLIEELETKYRYKVDFSDKYYSLPYISYSIAKIYLTGHEVYSRDFESTWTLSLNLWTEDLLKAEVEVHKYENITFEAYKNLIDRKSKYIGAIDGFVAKKNYGLIKVHYIDVGQADCILIQDGSTNMLIDAGNNDDEKTIIDYLKKQDIKKLDYVVVTHPHEDHIGSMDAVINTFDVGKVYAPRVTTTTKTFEDMLLAIKNKGLKISLPTLNEEIALGTGKFKILAPNVETYEDLNNNSIVLKLTYGSNSFLFTGDVEDVSEKEMLDKKYDLKADVLKVGHHGSKSSTTQAFLDAVNPKYAVISVGKGNDYGHPAAETVKRLTDKKATVYRTDEKGTILVETDGKVLTINGVSQAAPPVPQPTTVKVSASVSNTAPSKNATVVLTVNGPSTGKVTAVCKYKSKNTTYTGTIAKNGKVQIPIKIGSAAKGFKVIINITVSVNGKNYTTQASFTPK